MLAKFAAALNDREWPYWSAALREYEAIADDILAREQPRPDAITKASIATRVRNLCQRLRAEIERDRPAGEVADTAMTLTSALLNLELLELEQEVLVGISQLTRSEKNNPEVSRQAAAHLQWRAEAERVRVDRPHLKSKAAIAGVVKARLGLEEKVETIAKKI